MTVTDIQTPTGKVWGHISPSFSLKTPFSSKNPPGKGDVIYFMLTPRGPDKWKPCGLALERSWQRCFEMLIMQNVRSPADWVCALQEGLDQRDDPTSRGKAPLS